MSITADDTASIKSGTSFRLRSHRLSGYPDTGMAVTQEGYLKALSESRSQDTQTISFQSSNGQSDFLEEIKQAVMSAFVMDSVDLMDKVIIVGDSYVGKSTLLGRFCKESMTRNYKSTVGVDFVSQTFDILGKDFCLQIWDTAGQERYKSIVRSYYRGSSGVIIAFDLSSPTTLQGAIEWAKEVRSCVGDNLYIWLVGLKADLKHLISTRLGCEAAKSINAEYWEVSSETGLNVRELFHRIAAVLFQSSLKKVLSESVVPVVDIGRFSPQLDEGVSCKASGMCCWK